MLLNLAKYEIFLASQSPRRLTLLKDLGIDFKVISNFMEEEKYPENLQGSEIVEFLARQKARHVKSSLTANYLLITADTIVLHKNKVLNKPKNKDEAFEMLNNLSNDIHSVLTGVCLLSKTKEETFHSITKVSFKNLEKSEIEYYIDNYKPYDKAGAYGIQEWIGYIAVKKIEGSYFNVMGLPVQKLYEVLKNF